MCECVYATAMCVSYMGHSDASGEINIAKGLDGMQFGQNPSRIRGQGSQHFTVTENINKNSTVTFDAIALPKMVQ